MSRKRTASWTVATVFFISACSGGLSIVGGGGTNAKSSGPAGSSTTANGVDDSGGGGAYSEYSLAQRKVIKAQDEDFADELANTNEECGSNISASIHWPSFITEVDKRVANNLRKSISGHCAETLNGLWSYCREDDDYKAAIRAKVQSYECRYVDDVEARDMSFTDGHITLVMPWDSHNLGTYTKQFVGDVL